MKYRYNAYSDGKLKKKSLPAIASILWFTLLDVTNVPPSLGETVNVLPLTIVREFSQDGRNEGFTYDNKIQILRNT